MKNWKDKRININKVKENSSISAVFQGTANMLKIKNITVGCKKCTDYKFDEKTNKLTVTLKLGSIPIHLKERDDIPFRKTITVYYNNSTLDVLEIIGTKIKK